MAYSAFLSLFHSQYQVLCTCLYWSLPGLCATFPSAAMNPDLYNTQHCKIYIPMLWFHEHSQSTPCANSSSVVQLTMPAPAIRPRAASIAMTVQSCQTSSNSQPEVSLRLCFTHSRKHLQTHQEEGKESKLSWEIHGVVGTTNKS